MRAARLVVDTGMHAFKWTREDCIAYVQDITGIDKEQATNEVERYAVMPGQACAYKMGQRAILVRSFKKCSNFDRS